MDGFVRSSSSVIAIAVALATLGACSDELPPLEGTTSLKVELVSPTDPGSFDNRLPDSARDVTLSITALDANGATDTGFSGSVDFYVHFLGGLTPHLDAFSPLTSVEVTGGAAPAVNITLPPVFGPSFLWAENGRGSEPTYATGTSPTLWFRDPFLEDVSRPPDENALDALERSPLENKQINVTGSKYGANGRLVVTGTYAQGYTLSDVQCADANGTPPCVAGDYDHVFVFSFSRPEDEEGRSLATGQVIDRLTGSIGEFNGLTEVNFPQSFATSTDVDLGLVPAPVPIQSSWLNTRIEMERLEAALVALDNATLCPLDEEFEIYSQWKLDIGLGCGNPINVISAGQVAEFDPADYVGKVFPRVVGTLRPVNIGSFNVWIIYPRSIGDITLPSM
jgi:hypothetical protein